MGSNYRRHAHVCFSDSADVAHPEIFDLDADGYPSSQPGIPPDSFARKVSCGEILFISGMS